MKDRGGSSQGTAAGGHSFINPAKGGVYLKVHVQPRASRNEVCGIHQGALKIRLTAPPVEGEANRALVRFVSGLLGVKRSCVAVEKGESSRLKLLRIQGPSTEEAARLLERLAAKAD